jgi:hypothetical protein
MWMTSKVMSESTMASEFYLYAGKVGAIENDGFHLI